GREAFDGEGVACNGPLADEVLRRVVLDDDDGLVAAMVVDDARDNLRTRPAPGVDAQNLALSVGHDADGEEDGKVGSGGLLHGEVDARVCLAPCGQSLHALGELFACALPQPDLNPLALESTRRVIARDTHELARELDRHHRLGTSARALDALGTPT